MIGPPREPGKPISLARSWTQRRILPMGKPGTTEDLSVTSNPVQQDSTGRMQAKNQGTGLNIMQTKVDVKRGSLAGRSR
jgi:hypothetical protein